jgi:hypothetical protein
METEKGEITAEKVQDKIILRAKVQGKYVDWFHASLSKSEAVKLRDDLTVVLSFM